MDLTTAEAARRLGKASNGEEMGIRGSRAAVTEHPVALGSLRTWLRLVLRSGGIAPRQIPRLLFVILTTALTAPFKAWEAIRFGRAVRTARIPPSPIFIIGHWRSGTTHLQNLLAQDPALGFVSTFQAMAPGFSLVGEHRIKPWLARLAKRRHPTRLIDAIPLSMDAPQEDEFVMACTTHRAFVHVFTLPRLAERIFDRYVMLDDAPSDTRSKWKATYTKALRKASLHAGGRRLVLKNCAHTGRIRTLLELFPDAKFIHVHRDPYRVFLSTRHLFETVLPASQLQKIDRDRVDSLVLRGYEKLLRRYLEVRDAIPAGQLAEIGYDDLVRAPLEEVERLYRELGLPGFHVARPAIEKYLAAIRGYRTNRYVSDAAAIEKVNARWSFALEAWGYPRRDPAHDEPTAEFDGDAG
jgi:hypothetical protein